MSKIWKAVELLRIYAALGLYEPHELKFIENLFDNLNPYNPEDELTEKQTNLIKELYKKYIYIDFK